MKKQLVVFAILLSLAASARAQSKLAAPGPVSEVQYRHWPEQFTQWVGTDVPYSMLELNVDAGSQAQPTYEVVLTERSSAKKIYYSNVQALVDAEAAAGSESHLANIQFTRPANSGVGAIYLLRFYSEKSTPIIWRFVQGSEVTDQGSGVTPGRVNPPVLRYRQQAAVAGEGTALKVGSVVSQAEMWKEIAAPPYFMPYRGTYTQNLESLTFLDSSTRWVVERAPVTLSVGAAWQFNGANGQSCTVLVKQLEGNGAVFQQSIAGTQTVATFEAQLADGAWVIRSVHFEPVAAGTSKGLTLRVSPDGEHAKFEVLSGKSKIASGTLASNLERSHAGWHFKDPNWLNAAANN
jgi:hypothetical protein